jgi:hypothetical protein
MKTTNAPNPFTQRQYIYEIIMAMGDATCDEVETYTELLHQSVSMRIAELIRRGRVIWTGARRLTRSKRTARVYRGVPHGSSKCQSCEVK